MEKYLNNDEYLNNKVSIYFPSGWSNDMCGTLDIEKGKFDSLIIKLLKRYGRYTKTSETLYYYNNLIYKVTNGRKIDVLKRKSIDMTRVDNLLIEVSDYKNVNVNMFPIINKYHDITKKNRIEYLLGDMTVSLVTSSYADDNSKYSIEIYFVNDKVDHIKLKEVILFIESNL